jgi:hypothetical protein
MEAIAGRPVACRKLFGPRIGCLQTSHWIPPSRLTSAVSLYRSKFLDRLAGAVQYSYRDVDLLWDNVIAGLWMAPLPVREVPARRYTPRRAGNTCDMPG